MGERDREREREREIEESGIKDKKRSHQERHDRFFPHLLSTDFSRTRHHEFRTRYHEYYLFADVIAEIIEDTRGLQEALGRDPRWTKPERVKTEKAWS